MIDLGPCGFFDQERVLLVSALNVLKAKGIDECTLDNIMHEVETSNPDPKQGRCSERSPRRLDRCGSVPSFHLQS